MGLLSIAAPELKDRPFQGRTAKALASNRNVGCTRSVSYCSCGRRLPAANTCSKQVPARGFEHTCINASSRNTWHRSLPRQHLHQADPSSWI
jgi:hypothetical protein